MSNVMNVTGLRFLTNEARKLATVAIGIARKVVATCFKVQFNIAVFPFIFAYGGIIYVSKWFYNADSENASTVQPSSEVVCGNMKRLRETAMSNVIAMNSSRYPKDVSKEDKPEDEKPLVLSNLNAEDKISKENSDRNVTVASMKINEFSGRDLLWDIPIISAKAKHFAQCVKEERDDDMMEARKQLEQHPLEVQMPDAREILNDMKNKEENKNGNLKSRVIKFNYAETATADNCNANYCADPDLFEGKYRERKKNCFSDASTLLSQKRKTKCSYNPLLTQSKMCREISTVNKTLGKIQITGSRLLGELSNLNEILTKVISMKEKLASLEFQVDEGKRLLQEVECDRFIMKSKLAALEKLINEEEKFLSGDAFCESGFYESVETIGGF